MDDGKIKVGEDAYEPGAVHRMNVYEVEAGTGMRVEVLARDLRHAVEVGRKAMFEAFHDRVNRGIRREDWPYEATCVAQKMTGVYVEGTG